jgi:hypothetical protein
MNETILTDTFNSLLPITPTEKKNETKTQL